jgi:hypothetical protein
MLHHCAITFKRRKNLKMKLILQLPVTAQSLNELMCVLLVLPWGQASLKLFGNDSLIE